MVIKCGSITYGKLCGFCFKELKKFMKKKNYGIPAPSKKIG